MKQSGRSAIRSRVAGGALLVLVLLAGARVVVGQGPPARPDSGWSIEPRASADLWFHGLAVIGYEDGGGGLFPLYDSNYVNAVRQAKRDLGVYPTPLDSAGQEVLEEIRAEPALQLFHFIPLYFSRAGPNEMLAALSAVADQRSRDSAVAGPDVRFGAFIVAQSLTKRSERRALRDFVDLLQEEWDRFYSRYWDVFWRERLGMIETAQRVWSDDLAVALEPFLSRAHLQTGMIIPTPTLGLEGRIDDGDVFDPRDNIVAVHIPLDSLAPLSIAYGAVRELCFPILDQVTALNSPDLEDPEGVRGVAAVRCGAMLLEFYAPAFVPGYWRWYLTAAGVGPSGGTAAAFVAAYPLPLAVEQGLRQAMRGG